MLTADLKRNIIDQGPCQPPILQNYYTCQHRGIKILRKWLCFSPTSKKAYCNICWMFEGKTEWADGVTLSKKDGLVKRIDLHEKSIGHRECHKNFVQFKDSPIDHAMLKQRE